MSETVTLDIVVSFILFWLIALTPPLITRLIFLKRPMRKLWAFLFITVFWVVNFTAQYMGGVIRQEMVGGGSPKPGMLSLFFMAWATYAILTYNKEKQKKLMEEAPKPSPDKWTE